MGDPVKYIDDIPTRRKYLQRSGNRVLPPQGSDDSPIDPERVDPSRFPSSARPIGAIPPWSRGTACISQLGICITCVLSGVILLGCTCSKQASSTILLRARTFQKRVHHSVISTSSGISPGPRTLLVTIR